MNGLTRGNAIRIFVVDDHPVMRRGLSQIINAEPNMQICGEASEMNEALRQIDETRPDLVIIDISLGNGGNGIELIKEVKASHPDMRMLVSSMHDESLFAERALRAGALGYVNKHEPPDTLVQAIRQVLGGRIALSSQMTERLLHQVASTGEMTSQSPLERLTDRELEVFEMIGHGLNTKQIAVKLDLSPKTIETYREHIKSKLNLDSSAELARHAVQWVLQGN